MPNAYQFVKSRIKKIRFHALKIANNTSHKILGDSTKYPSVPKNTNKGSSRPLLKKETDNYNERV